MFSPDNAEDFELTKKSLRIDTDDDDDLLKKLMSAAIYTLIGKIGTDKTFYDGDAKDEFDISVMFLTDHLYRTRSATIEGTTVTEIPLSVQTFLLSLKADYKVYILKKEAEIIGG
ncbi:head-tail connector protein [Listeria seeligeri]|uniref:head-tail connector protein n=1 Tax=Listeria seeligeri TaxID=1640 RepID=UPI0022EACEDA|nr:head-tail connector protein [Listeria seeligeri]